jgi:hypothetical protein
MNKNVRTVLSCIVVVCMTVAILCGLTNLLERKASDVKYYDFYEQEEDFDVLFFGTSHVINGIFPMELWNDYGIVSYNFGGPGNPLATSYWIMENSLEYTNPKLVVIDGYMLSSEWKCSVNFSNVHRSFDSMPLNIVKLKAIWDLMDDMKIKEAIQNGTVTAEPRTKIGLLWDYSVYHARWSELAESDFEVSPSYEKGANLLKEVVRADEIKLINKNQKMDGGNTGDEYIRRMIEDCQSRGIEVLLTYIPFPANENSQKEANYMYDLSDEYGINYINYLDLDLINYQTDLKDATSHVNASGARKVTDYIGRYIMNNYDISDQRGNAVYSDWFEDYEEYKEFKNNNFREQNDIEVYLMLLYDDDIDVVIDIGDNTICENKALISLLSNAGVDVSKINPDTDFIIIKDRGALSVSLDDFREDGISVDTEIGNVRLLYDVDDNEEYSLYIDGEKYLSGNTSNEYCMRICIRRDNELVDNVSFNYSINPSTSNIETSVAER